MTPTRRFLSKNKLTIFFYLLEGEVAVCATWLVMTTELRRFQWHQSTCECHSVCCSTGLRLVDRNRVSKLARLTTAASKSTESQIFLRRPVTVLLHIYVVFSKYEVATYGWISQSCIHLGWPDSTATSAGFGSHNPNLGLPCLHCSDQLVTPANTHWSFSHLRSTFAVLERCLQQAIPYTTMTK